MLHGRSIKHDCGKLSHPEKFVYARELINSCITCREKRWCRFVAGSCFPDQQLWLVSFWRLAVAIACRRLAATEISFHLGTTLPRASSVDFTLLFMSIFTYHLLSSITFTVYLAIWHLFFLVLAYNICCIMTQSISMRLSLMVCIKTVHSGSGSCQSAVYLMLWDTWELRPFLED